MADEKKFNLDIEPARLTTAASHQRHQLRKDTRSRMIKGLKWVALAVFVLFTLDTMLVRVFTLIHLYPYQNGVQVGRSVWMDRAKDKKYREYVEAKQSVTEGEAREMLVKEKMRTVIGEFLCANG